MIITDEQVEKNFNEYISLIQNNIKRDGVDRLIKWLENKDTKIAPASTRYHLSCKGGLVAHSLFVYKRLKQLLDMEYKLQDNTTTCPYTDETIAIVALLHDISKVDFYEVQERNTKDENGNWIKVPVYQVKPDDKRFTFGSHAMNSVYMLSKFINLSYEESLAILHHMGGLDTTEDTLNCRNISEAYIKSPLALFLHFADELATFKDETVKDSDE